MRSDLKFNFFMTILGLSALILTVVTCVSVFSEADGDPVTDNLAYTIVIDAGHGGIDGGVIGTKSGVKESDLNLKVARELYGLLKENGFNVIMTRTDENGLYGDWYTALVSMIENLLNDSANIGKPTKRGKELLSLVHKYKSVLEKAPCTMVNYDLWDSNIICGKSGNGNTEFTLIDPERSIWGDPVLDFLCLENFFAPISEKKKSVEYHNRLCPVKIELNRETAIRYAFAQGLMALIQEAEKFYRFSHFGQGWALDIISSNTLYRKTFEVLKNE